MCMRPLGLLNLKDTPIDTVVEASVSRSVLKNTVVVMSSMPQNSKYLIVVLRQESAPMPFYDRFFPQAPCT